MNKDVGIGLLLFLLFIVEPILIGICARKIYDRAGAFWGLLAFGINIGILVFFESCLRSSSLFDTTAEIASVMGLSVIFIFSIFEAFRSGPHNIKRGVFRICITISAVWTVFVVIEFLEYSKYSCEYLHYFLSDKGICFESYWDVAKWFIGIPALVFVIGLAACWVVEGFRRPAPN